VRVVVPVVFSVVTVLGLVGNLLALASLCDVIDDVTGDATDDVIESRHGCRHSVSVVALASSMSSQNDVTDVVVVSVWSATCS